MKKITGVMSVMATLLALGLSAASQADDREKVEELRLQYLNYEREAEALAQARAALAVRIVRAGLAPRAQSSDKVIELYQRKAEEYRPPAGERGACGDVQCANQCSCGSDCHGRAEDCFGGDTCREVACTCSGCSAEELRDRPYDKDPAVIELLSQTPAEKKRMP